MARTKTTNTEKLLNRLRTKPMTRKEIVKYLLQLNGQGAKSYNDSDSNRGLYSALLYGTTERTGILERFCSKDFSGKWYVPKYCTINAPFTTRRGVGLGDLSY